MGIEFATPLAPLRSEIGWAWRFWGVPMGGESGAKSSGTRVFKVKRDAVIGTGDSVYMAADVSELLATV